MKRAMPLLAVCLLCGCMPSNPPNIMVNEHVFLKVKDHGEAYAREVLGTPNREGPGEVVKYEVPGNAEIHFTIAESCTTGDPSGSADHFLRFDGNNKESIRLLYSGSDRKFVAAEYLLDETQVRYSGRQDPGCRSIPMPPIPPGSRETDTDFARRRRILKEFFNQQEMQSVFNKPGPSPAPPATSVVPSPPAKIVAPHPEPPQHKATENANVATEITSLPTPDVPASPPGEIGMPQLKPFPDERTGVTEPAPLPTRLSGQVAANKPPVPDEAAQAAAIERIKKVYGDEWAAARTAGQKSALAKKLLQKAKETEEDDATRFVLFRLSRDGATRAMDGLTAFQAIDEMNDSFQIDALEMRTTVLSQGASIATTIEQHWAVANKAAEVSDEAVRAGNLTIAKQLNKLALGEARQVSDPALIKRLSQRAAEIEGLLQSR